MLRNKEFRQFAAWFALAAVAAVVLGFAANTAAGVLYLLWIYQKQIPEHCKDFGADRYGAP